MPGPNPYIIDTDSIIIRNGFFMLPNSYIPQSTNSVVTVGQGGAISYTDALANLSTYGIGYLPDVFSTLNGQLSNLSTTIYNGGVTYTDFSSACESLSTNIVDLSNWTKPQLSTLSTSIGDLSNLFNTTVYASSVTQGQLLSTTAGLESSINLNSTLTGERISSSYALLLTNPSGYAISSSVQTLSTYVYSTLTPYVDTINENLTATASTQGIKISSLYGEFYELSSFAVYLFLSTPIVALSTLSAGQYVLTSNLSSLASYTYSLASTVSTSYVLLSNLSSALSTTNTNVAAISSSLSNYATIANLSTLSTSIGDINAALSNSVTGNNISTLSTALSNYATLANLSTLSVSMENYATKANLSTLSTALSNYATLANLSTLSTSLSNYVGFSNLSSLRVSTLNANELILRSRLNVSSIYINGNPNGLGNSAPSLDLLGSFRLKTANFQAFWLENTTTTPCEFVFKNTAQPFVYAFGSQIGGRGMFFFTGAGDAMNMDVFRRVGINYGGTHSSFQLYVNGNMYASSITTSTIFTSSIVGFPTGNNISTLSTALNNYATKDNLSTLSTALNNYATKDNLSTLSTALSNYATLANLSTLSTALSNYATLANLSTLSTALSNYATLANLSTLSVSLENYAMKDNLSTLSTALSNYATLANLSTLSIALNSYATGDNVSTLSTALNSYATGENLSTLSSALSNYIAFSNLSSVAVSTITLTSLNASGPLSIGYLPSTAVSIQGPISGTTDTVNITGGITIRNQDAPSIVLTNSLAVASGTGVEVAMCNATSVGRFGQGGPVRGTYINVAGGDAISIGSSKHVGIFGGYNTNYALTVNGSMYAPSIVASTIATSTIIGYPTGNNLSTLSTALNNYATLANLSTLSTALNNYATLANLSTLSTSLENYATKENLSTISTALNNYATLANLSTLSTALSNYVGFSNLSSLTVSTLNANELVLRNRLNVSSIFVNGNTSGLGGSAPSLDLLGSFRLRTAAFQAFWLENTAATPCEFVFKNTSLGFVYAFGSQIGTRGMFFYTGAGDAMNMDNNRRVGINNGGTNASFQLYVNGNTFTTSISTPQVLTSSITTLALTSYNSISTTYNECSYAYIQSTLTISTGMAIGTTSTAGYLLNANGGDINITNGVLRINNAQQVPVSDERIKENISSISLETCLSTLEAVPLRTYNFRPDYAAYAGLSVGPQVGVIAQEVSDIFPESIQKISQYGIEDLNLINYNQLYLTAVGATKKLAERERVHTSTIQGLEQQIQAINGFLMSTMGVASII